MLQFILGVLVGGFIGFCLCAIISINNTDKDENIPTPSKKSGVNSDARSK